MENQLSAKDFNKLAEEVTYNTYINSYLREIDPGIKYFSMPKYDPVIAAYFKERNHSKWIKLSLNEIQKEFFCALSYYSETGRHQVAFPVVIRDKGSSTIKDVPFYEFVHLTLKNYTLQRKDKTLAVNTLLERITESVNNLNSLLQHRYWNRENLAAADQQQLSFIEAEQAFVLGHSNHPMAKSRLGFSEQELLRYSPETGEKFQLHYFLADPSIVWEGGILEKPVGLLLREQLLNHSATNDKAKNLLKDLADWRVVPSHPWEANYLKKQNEVSELLKAGKLIDLGLLGPEFTATSSIRTVYNDECDLMYKLSLHVKITNSERVNIQKELYRSLDMSRLFASSIGNSIKEKYPDFEAITDPAFIGITYNGKPINGFNTSFRYNPFRNKQQNVTLLAALCQDAVLEAENRISKLVRAAAQQQNKPIEEVSKNWFKKYLKVGFRNLFYIYNELGLGFEAHQQNTLLELDETGFPVKFFFRDNQGFYFRETKISKIQEVLPELGIKSESFGPDSFINPKFTYYLVINNIFGVINTFGRNSLINESVLLDIFLEELLALQPKDETGLIDFILNSRDWEVKGNLLTRLHDMDEVLQPIDNQSVYVDYPNPLMKRFFVKELIAPETKTVLFERYFPTENVTLSLRPIDLEKDLEMVHDWFNRDHTKTFWKMDGPIQELETFYLNLLASDAGHAFIGEVNGEPTFTIEPYWPMRDVVGKYYDALPTDYGFHVLIAPTEKSKKHSTAVLRVAVELLFSFPKVGRCIGEPDKDNQSIKVLGLRVGFTHEDVISMPHKTANLLICTRDSYQEKLQEAPEEQALTNS